MHRAFFPDHERLETQSRPAGKPPLDAYASQPADRCARPCGYLNARQMTILETQILADLGEMRDLDRAFFRKIHDRAAAHEALPFSRAEPPLNAQRNAPRRRAMDGFHFERERLVGGHRRADVLLLQPQRKVALLAAGHDGVLKLVFFQSGVVRVEANAVHEPQRGGVLRGVRLPEMLDAEGNAPIFHRLECQRNARLPTVSGARVRFREGETNGHPAHVFLHEKAGGCLDAEPKTRDLGFFRQNGRGFGLKFGQRFFSQKERRNGFAWQFFERIFGFRRCSFF